jgi:Protein of unknown function (DUF1822)
MKVSQASLSKIYAEHLWLELSDEDLQLAKPNPRHYSNETGRNYAYFNRLCLNAFRQWIETIAPENPVTEFPAGIGSKLWEFFTGCGINFAGKRLVLIPSDAIDLADFAVPQEWVDIPSLAADYYLPVRVDLAEKTLHFWGFVSRQTLKAKADYDKTYRLYYLEGDWINSNLEMLEAVANLCPKETGKMTVLPRLSDAEAKNLIAELSNPSPYSPRLKAKFEQWGALLNESRWLQQLYQQRVEPSLSQDLRTANEKTGVSASFDPPKSPLTRGTCVSPIPVVFNLSMWLDGIVEAGWQTFDEWFNAKIPAFRAKQVRGIELDTPEKIKRAVRQLRNSQIEVNFPADIQDPDALLHLMQHTHDETIRWKAAEYLWTIEPNYSNPAIRRVMDLGVQLTGHPIALMIAVLRKLDGRIAVLLRAYPMGGQTKLPPDLRLMVLDENGDRIPGLEAISRSEPLDDYIALYFTADAGDRFNVSLALEQTHITEQFVV